MLERIVAGRGRPPQLLRMDNGPELTANSLRDWCRFGGSGSAYIEPGSPWQNLLRIDGPVPPWIYGMLVVCAAALGVYLLILRAIFVETTISRSHPAYFVLGDASNDTTPGTRRDAQVPSRSAGRR